jgi:addiction module RelE/StbE family toxin
MAYQVIITEPAERDLTDICKYIAEKLHSPGAALAFLDDVEKRVSALDDMPYKYALVSDKRLAIMGIRKIPVKNYLVFYLVDEEKQSVAVVRVLYGRRNWSCLI